MKKLKKIIQKSKKEITYFDDQGIKKKIVYWFDELEFKKLIKQLIIYGENNRFDPKYTPPFRVGKKQGKAVLDATGREVIFFSDSEEQAKKYCNYLNGKDLLCNHKWRPSSFYAAVCEKCDETIG